MQFSYRAFGLEIAADSQLPTLATSSSMEAPDVRIRVGSLPTLNLPSRGPLYVSPYRDGSGESALHVFRLDDGAYYFAYRDFTQFVVDQFGSDVWVDWPSWFSVHDAIIYLFGPIFGFLLRLRGIVSLHASGVLIGDVAIALLGQAGAGKSTTAAAFARLGYPVITDDVFALIDHGACFSAQPAYPGLRLWPDSVRSLWGTADALPPITPNWDKRKLDLEHSEYRFGAEPAPLAAVYILGERSAAPTAPEILPPGEPPLLNLLANTYVNYLLDKQARAHEFEVLGRLAGSVVFRQAIPHTDAGRLPELCEMIVADVRSRSDTHV